MMTISSGVGVTSSMPKLITAGVAVGTSFGPVVIAIGDDAIVMIGVAHAANDPINHAVLISGNNKPIFDLTPYLVTLADQLACAWPAQSREWKQPNCHRHRRCLS